MIIEEMVLHNFGPYKGKQRVQLLPPSAEQPIILFGGMNGVGKTTFLDSIQLALYGKRADCSNRRGQSYEKYLQKCIHRAANPEEGAGVEIRFRHWSGGKECVYHIKRSWQGTERIKDYLLVSKDGHPDSVLTEMWNEQVETFIPQRLSKLFLFDGEQIEALADLENSADLLGQAMQSLLGLDLVDKLVTDLQVLEKKKKKTFAEEKDLNQIQKLEKELSDLFKKNDTENEALAQLMNQIDAHEKKMKEHGQLFQEAGGHLYEQRLTIETEQIELLHRLEHLEQELIDLIAGPLPMLLVKPLLDKTIEQDSNERESTRAQAIQEILLERDQELLQRLQDLLQEPDVDKISEYLADDRIQYTQKAQWPLFLHFNEKNSHLLASLLTTQLPDSLRSAKRLFDSIENMNIKLADVKRKLNTIPAKESIQALVETDNKLKEEKRELDFQKRKHEESLAVYSKEIEFRSEKLKRVFEKDAEVKQDQEATKRVMQYSNMMQGVMKNFRQSILKRNVYQIEQLVLESYRQLLRKSTLVHNLNIDPETLKITLYGENNQVLSSERLSAGERQLLAISILWGLSRASGRTLPAVIDTPLGRLDSSHRTHLVERYFPYASHQVLLLSTDEEVSPGYYEKIKPWLGHSYLLDYDDSDGVTHIRPGYFWEN